MIQVLAIIGAIGLAVQAFIGLSFFISCIQERESRATVFGLVQFVVMLAILVAYLILMQSGFFQTGSGKSVLVAGYVMAGLGAILLLKKSRPNHKALQGTKGAMAGEVRRLSETEILFSRMMGIHPGTERYEEFYREHPEYKEVDDNLRAKQPHGIFGKRGAIDSPNEKINLALQKAASAVAFGLGGGDKVKPARDFMLKMSLGEEKVEISSERATETIKGFAKHLGAVLVGVAEINPLWFYTHKGSMMEQDWGKEITVDHKYAIVFAEEMDFDLVGTAPHTSADIESYHCYSTGAFISVEVAAFIANLGFSATANHFMHYEANMVPLAIDAGLGELSRMGYLITKEFGPRVRLSAVTTDLSLIPDKPVDIGVEDFCRICKKCSNCCPSQSIPDEDQTVFNGIKRWKLNAETCFDYWRKIGTYCNVCMRTCPWSHARTFPHRLIVAMITRNALSRRLFNAMDDIFYGKKPKAKGAPEWAKYN